VGVVAELEEVVAAFVVAEAAIHHDEGFGVGQEMEGHLQAEDHPGVLLVVEMRSRCWLGQGHWSVGGNAGRPFFPSEDSQLADDVSDAGGAEFEEFASFVEVVLEFGLRPVDGLG